MVRACSIARFPFCCKILLGNGHSTIDKKTLDYREF